MLKPSEEIKMIFEEIRSGRKPAEVFSAEEMSDIIQAIIHHLDINASVAEEKRTARG